MELLILGSANGESLVLVVDDWVCVVDSHRVRGSNPVVTYLDEKKLSKIDMLVITHPHFDHYEGVDDYGKYEVRRLLLFPDIGLTQLRKILKLWIEEARLNQAGASSIVDTENDKLTKLMAFVVKYREKLARNFEIVSQAKTIASDHPDIKIEAVGPFSHIYSKEMEKLTAKAYENTLTLLDASKADNYNALSICLLITWRNFKILLLADATDEILDEIQSTIDLGPYDLIKVSHHGSSNGNPPSFWEFISSHGKATNAVVTHHSRHSIPKDQVLEMIKEQVGKCGGRLHIVELNQNSAKGILFKFDESSGEITSIPWSNS